MEDWVNAVSDGTPLLSWLQWVIRDDMATSYREAIFRGLLQAFPLSEAWDVLDSEGGPSIETILLTVRSLRWDLREEQEESLLKAVQQRAGRETLDLSGGLFLGSCKPATLGDWGWPETIEGSDLSKWKPQKINLKCLRVSRCTGPLELGASMALEDPEEASGHNVLEVSPDIEVRNSAPSLAGRNVKRTFEGDWKATYFVSQGCEGWSLEHLDPSGMDLTMPVTYDDLLTPEQLENLPLGAVTEIRYGSLPHLPRHWDVQVFLDLWCLENLKALPEDFKIQPKPISERCDQSWSRYPHHALMITDCPNFEWLPEDLYIPIGLSLTNLPNLRTLPTTLRCNSILAIDQCPITELPDTLRDFQELHLKDVLISHLPDQLQVRDCLWLDGLSKLKHLPSKLVVEGMLGIAKCGLTELPPGLRVGKDLRIWGSENFESLPFDLQVGEDFWMDKLPLVSGLPPGVQVGGDLTIEECSAFEMIPRQPKVKGMISLRDLPSLKALPAGFTAPGGCSLATLPALAALPKDLSVKGFLRLEDLPIHTLPESIHLEGDLAVVQLRNFVHWPSNLNHIRGDLWLEFLPGLSVLPENLIVKGRLTIRDCPSLKQLPKGLVAGSVECSEELAKSAKNPLRDWSDNASDHQRHLEKMAGDPLAQIGENPEIQKGLGFLSLMALLPEFKLVGRFLDQDRYEISLKDCSGNGHPDELLRVCTSSAIGFRCTKQDFLLSPTDLESLYDQALCTLEKWGFKNLGGMFTYLTDPEPLQQAMQPFLDQSNFLRPNAVPRPYHLHLDFWRKDFKGGGVVVPFRSQSIFEPPEPFQVVLPR